jgi:hypothetical protein
MTVSRWFRLVRLPRSASRAGNRARSSPAKYRPRLEAFEDRLLPSTFLVTNINDSGAGSLRAAIAGVNKPSATQGVIDFKIAGAGAHTINLKSALPIISRPVVIDGTSQPGYAGTPLVILNGSGVPGADGITIQATGLTPAFSATVKGLGINGFFDGIKLADSGAATPVTAQFVSNSITSAPGGDGMLLFAGTSSTTVQVGSNSITTSATGDGIVAFTAGTSTAFTIGNNTLHVSGGGDAVRVQGGGVSNTVTLSLNHIFQSGGDGVVIASGPNSTTAKFFNNTITVNGLGDGVVITTAGKSMVLNFQSNVVQTNGGGDGVRVDGNASSNNLTFTTNHVFTKNLGDALTLALASSTKTIARVTNNIFNTNGSGTGLTLNGGATFQAIVQGNGFGGNMVGVAVFGNGTTAGNVDLGGGSLGSTGGNDFRSFKTATADSYAIGLFNVASSYSMDAKNNLFSVSPGLVIADGTHDPAAGGKGSIIV